MNLRLGIDTGGTYTDAVLVDGNNTIIEAAKCLTTHHDLTIGIRQSLDRLPMELLMSTQLVSLSTTLSTNSVVEGRGEPVAVLLPGYRHAQVEKSGLKDIFDSALISILDGGHDATGRERCALDEDQCRSAIAAVEGKVSAFAISSMFGVRNPAHEIQLRDLVEELTGKPVTCGHELASSLDAPRRALTVALNARMVPIIRQLILAVKKILSEKAIVAPLMMVKGDGSLINTETALKQPVSTVLSGPAASVVGACALSGRKNAIIADMGGTTTDIAVVSNGKPKLGEDGVRIGDWNPMVQAVRVISIGLGGDSEVRFSATRGMDIGPRRVVPVSLLGRQHPSIRKALEKQLERPPSRRNNRFAVPMDFSETLMRSCTPQEQLAWNRVCEAPVELDSVVESNRELSRAIARLHRRGMVIYSGFTPTDAAHVLGKSDHWCTDSARLASLLWARQMRQIYGVGRWEDGDAIAPARQVHEHVGLQISQALIEAGLHQHEQLDNAQLNGLTSLLANLIFESSSLFQVEFANGHPVVAVGAPASTFFPDAARRLSVELIMPSRADVANAFGAVMGSVVQTARVLVTQPLHGQFIVHAHDGPRSFNNWDQALELATDLAQNRVRKQAQDAGAAGVEIQITREDNRVEHDIDGDLFLESCVIATATGRPALR